MIHIVCVSVSEHVCMGTCMCVSVYVCMCLHVCICVFVCFVCALGESIQETDWP